MIGWPASCRAPGLTERIALDPRGRDQERRALSDSVGEVREMIEG